jgi:hypothetical protein
MHDLIVTKIEASIFLGGQKELEPKEILLTQDKSMCTIYMYIMKENI